MEVKITATELRTRTGTGYNSTVPIIYIRGNLSLNPKSQKGTKATHRGLQYSPVGGGSRPQNGAQKGPRSSLGSGLKKRMATKKMLRYAQTPVLRELSGYSSEET